MTQLEYIQFEIKDAIAFITLNRLDRHNALNFAFIKELKDALSIAEFSQEVKIIILKANGKYFSAGYDLEYVKRLQQFGYEENLYDANHICDLYLQLYKLRKVTISQVEGNAYATGCGLAAFTDLCFAVPNAYLGFPEVKFGFIPTSVIPFLVRKIGEGRTRELLLSGDVVPAARAQQLGLINYIYPQDAIRKEVLQFAKRIISQNSADCMDLTRRMIGDVAEMDLVDAITFTTQINARARISEECKMGVSNFLAKRKQSW